MKDESRQAAHRLADTLYVVADSLGSDDLATMSDAMIQVRAAARDLARSLEARGWGGGVLYGFGEPGKAEEAARTADEIEQMIADGELELGWDDEPTNPGEHLPEGRRVSVQTRLDYVITDELALRRYVRDRVDAQVEKADIHDELVFSNPVMMLNILDGIEQNDYSEHGLAVAGFQSMVRPISKCLTEMGWDDASDTFPTASP